MNDVICTYLRNYHNDDDNYQLRLSYFRVSENTRKPLNPKNFFDSSRPLMQDILGLDCCQTPMTHPKVLMTLQTHP